MSAANQKQLFQEEPLPLPWESAAEGDRLAARLVFNRPLDEEYSYLVPDALRDAIGPGQRVEAPFGKGNRPLTGFCVSVGPAEKSRYRLKEISAVIDREALLSPEMLKLTRWIADHYLCAWGQVLETVVPAGVKKQAGTRLITCFELADGARDAATLARLPAKQQAIVRVLADATSPMAVDELTAAVNCGTAPITALRKRGLIRAVRQRTEAEGEQVEPVTRIEDLKLNPEQRAALEAIHDALSKQEHVTFLMHGVTGSGKTEVYIQAIREVVAYGRQAIVLVPEISLTPQTIRRFRSRFPSVAVLHSHLSDSERHWQWQQIARGGVQVVVGARSAVFAPTPHLGLIVIDEEHETTFKQESVPRYHARDVARERARMENVPLILGSATPTLESWLRVEQKQDRLLSMPNRVEQLPLPPVVIVDVRNDPFISKGAAIGRALFLAMRRALEDAGQIILFLNLRGFTPVLWCQACGEPVRCPDCTVSITWHKDRQKAICHSCGFEADPPRRCPACGHAGIKHLGVGTQRLEQEVRAAFPA